MGAVGIDFENACVLMHVISLTGLHVFFSSFFVCLFYYYYYSLVEK